MRRHASKSFPSWTCAIALATAAHAQAPSPGPELFVDASTHLALSPQQAAVLRRVVTSPSSDIRYVTLRANFLDEPYLRLQLEVDAPALGVVRQRIEVQGAARVWVGEVERKDGMVVLAEHDGGVTGIVDVGGGSYRLTALGNGLHALRRVEDDTLRDPSCTLAALSAIEPAPRGEAPVETGVPERLTRALSPGPPERVDSETVIVNVLVGYLEPAAQSTPNFASHVAALITWANQAMVRSRVHEAGTGPVPMLRLAAIVGLECDVCTSSISNAQLLAWFAKPDDGALDVIHAARETVEADVCVLMTGIDRSGSNGVAITGRPAPERAFCLVETPYSRDRAYILAHEIAHLFDAQHETGAVGAQPYARAFCHNDPEPGNRFWTVMCTQSSNRAPYFSNPSVSFITAHFDTLLMGNAQRNNARRIAETALLVASHRGRGVVPIQVRDFWLRRQGDEVVLSWRVSGHVVGDLLGVRVLRATHPEGPYVERTRGMLAAEPRMRFQDRLDASRNGHLWYKLALHAVEGSVSFAGPLRLARGSAPETDLAPPVVTENGLWAEYSVGPQAQRVEIAVYDVRGRRVRVLQDGVLEPGTRAVTWDGRRPNGAAAARGVYLLRMRAAQRTAVHKFALFALP